MSTTKQVLVYRRDLYSRSRTGKTAAQIAHASLKVFLDRGEIFSKGKKFEMTVSLTPAMLEWMESGFAKICVYVEDENELLDIYQKAKDAGIPCSLITDAGRTEFGGVPTKTAVAIGPDYAENIDPITKHLKLL